MAQSGPATIDMWDNKPEAPEGIRGEFKSINTKAAGIVGIVALTTLLAALVTASVTRPLRRLTDAPAWVTFSCADPSHTCGGDVLADAVAALPGVACVYERSDADVREREGLGERTGLLRGNEPSPDLVANEAGFRFAVDVAGGHKTEIGRAHV